LFSALVSLLTGRNVRSDTAMTGEISLRGLVLPVGGIKEKTAAAVRAGLKRVVLPARNKKDLEDISEDVRSKLEFIWTSEVGEVLEAVLEDEKAAPNAPAGGV
jgi:ATP-dependent Lon protease